MAFKAGQKLLASDLAKIGPVARYARRTGDGNQTVAGGDQILSFPTAAREDPSCGVTRQGTGNTSFRLETGSYIMSASTRFTQNCNAGLYLAEGTTFTNEDNGFQVGNCINFVVAGATDVITVDSPTDFCVGLWRDGATPGNVTAWGKDLTHVAFMRLA